MTEEFDPGPCPHCGERDYRINYVEVDTGDPFLKRMPTTVDCLNPDCPGRIENENGEAVPSGGLCTGWDNADPPSQVHNPASRVTDQPHGTM